MAEKTVYIIDLDDKVTPKLKVVQGEAKKTDSAFAGFKNIGSALGIAVGVGSLVSLAKGIYDVTSEAEQAKIKFEVMLGSVDKADKMISQIRQFAAATPFETSHLEEAATTMLGFGIAAEDIMPNIKMLGDISMGNAEKFQRVTYAFSQISATGRLMGQDLMQLINAGFNPLQTISEKTGISMKDLKKKMEDGAISADMVKNAFISETTEGGRFFGMMDKQAQTMSGKMSTLVDNIKMMGLQIGESGAGIFHKIIDSGLQAVEVVSNSAWSDFFRGWYEMTNVFAPIQEAFAGILQMFGMGTSLGIGFQHVIDSITLSFRLLVLPIKAITDTIALLVEVLNGIGIATGKLAQGDYEGAMDAFGGVKGKFEKLKKDFTGIMDFEGGRGFGEAPAKKEVVPIDANAKFNPKGFDDLYKDTSKSSKSKKQTAGGMTLNESKNGATHITFNIDTFQKNEFSKDGTNINNSSVKSFLDQMAMGLMTVLNDAQIVARQ